MDYSNKISTTISKKDIKEIQDAINFIDDKLPDLDTLTSEERAALPKMEKNTINFVLESLVEAEKYPEQIPQNIEVDEIRKDVELINSIYKILDPLQKLAKKLEDSALLAGSEAYLPSIGIYNAMKAEAIRRKHSRRKALV